MGDSFDTMLSTWGVSRDESGAFEVTITRIDDKGVTARCRNPATLRAFSDALLQAAARLVLEAQGGREARIELEEKSSEQP